MLNGNSAPLGPRQQRGTDQFWAIGDMNGKGLPAPFDDAVQRAYHLLRRQREVSIDA